MKEINIRILMQPARTSISSYVVDSGPPPLFESLPCVLGLFLDCSFFEALGFLGTDVSTSNTSTALCLYVRRLATYLLY